MKYFKSESGQVFAFEADGSQDQYIPAELVPMTEAEVNLHLNPPPPVPQWVTRAQGKAALIQAGLWTQVLAFVESISDPQQKALAEVALNDTQTWQRNSPFLAAAASALGVDDADLDALFVTAATIEL